MTDTEKSPNLISQNLLDNNPHRGPTWYEELPHDSYYYTGFWGSYKGYVKGMLGGMIIGAMLGGVIGLAAAGAAAIVGGAAVTFTGIAGGMALVFGLLGTLKGFHEFSTIGSNAGIGVALDELEVRTNRTIDNKLNGVVKKMAALMGKEKELPDINAAVNAETDAITPVKQYSDSPHVDSATAATTKLFHGKVALFGILLGAAVGALICVAAGPAGIGALAAGGIGKAISLLGVHEALAVGETLGQAALLKAGTAAIVTACGLFGASFGLDRLVFRRVFDFTDKLFAGRVLPQNLVAHSRNPKIQQAADISAIPIIPAIPQPAVPDAPAASNVEIPETQRKNWVQKVKTEQVLASFDHTQARMQ